MGLFFLIFMLGIGLTLLTKGADWLVDGASSLGRKNNISELSIGLTIVAFGTSAPELVVSIVSSLQNHQDIVLGNIIGSNNFNLFLILSISSMIRPIQYSIQFNRDLIFLALGTLFLFVAMFTAQRKKLDRWEAGLLLIVNIGYMVFLFREEI